MDTITSKLEAAHKEWLDKIRSWESELGEMEATNGTIAGKDDSKESQKKVEHFQNQIIIQKGRLDKMKHNIKLYGGDLEKGAKDIEDYSTYFNTFSEEFSSFSQQFS